MKMAFPMLFIYYLLAIIVVALIAVYIYLGKRRLLKNRGGERQR